MSAQKSMRVYFVTHHDGRRTGTLLRTWSSFFDGPPPSAYGADEDDVLRQLEDRLLRMEADGSDVVDRYLWTEPFHTRQVRIDVHPLSSVKKRPVVGKTSIPLRVTYAWLEVKGDKPEAERGEADPPRAYRVMIPRFGGWVVLEDLETAPEVLRTFLSAALMGENPRWIYDYRAEGEEYVKTWSPDLLARRLKEPEAKEELPEELVRVSDDLVAQHERGKLAPVIGDPPELTQIAAYVNRTPPPSVLLVGPSGSGKSALVRRTAKLLVDRARAREKGEKPHLWTTSADRLIAGMVWLGQWQERVLKIMEELSGRGEWLHVDRLAALAQSQPDGTSIAEMLEPAIAAGDVSILAEATPSELELLQRRHASLLSKFRVLRVNEKTTDATIALVGPYAARKPNLALHPGAVARMVRHGADLQRDQALPGKAFRFVDWLASTTPQTGDKRTFYARDISQAFSQYTGIPVELISDEYAASADDLAARLRTRVIGQDGACAACGRLLARFKAGMSDPDRPAGTFLFVGPTGVGKTELAKQLARATFGDDKRLIRLDMSEYGLRGSAQRLLDASDGATSLAQQMKKQPLSLVLLDEIEKAHPEVFDLLLGVLGEGRLTDGNGRLVDFRGSIVVMTSNLGVTEHAPAGFGERTQDGFEAAVRRHFRPELFNRIDYVLSFRALAMADVEKIVDLTVEDVRARTGLSRRGLSLTVTDRARSRLAQLGFHPTRGARPLKRVVEELVVTPLAAMLAADSSIRDRKIAVLGDIEPAPEGAIVVRV